MAVKTYKKTLAESNYTLLGEHADGVNSENVTGLTPATTYNFKAVPVVNGVDDEGNALYDTATTFHQDQDFMGVTDSESSQTIMWSKQDGATGYELERALNSDFSDATQVYSGTNTFYHDTGLTPGTVYYYRVRAIGSTAWTTYTLSTPYLFELFKEQRQGINIQNDWIVESGEFTYKAAQLEVVKGTASEAIMQRDLGVADLYVSTYIQSIAGMGLLFRYVDANNFLMTRFDTVNGVLQIYERVSGNFTLLASQALTVKSDSEEPQELNVSAQGDIITVTVEHYNTTLSVTTSRFNTATKIGLRSICPSTNTILDVCGYIVAYPTVIEQNQFKLYGILEYFQEPVAVRYIGRFDRTYESYVSRWGEIVIRWYDNKAQRFGPLYYVDELLSEHGIEAMDDHNPPCLHILPTGKIILWYGVHNVDKIFYQKISVESENISSFGVRLDMTDTDIKPYNYPSVLQLSDLSLVLFYRVGVFSDSKYVYKKSTDQGATWGAPVTLTSNSPNGVYLYVAQNPDNLDEIHCAGYFAYDSGDVRRRNIWYAKNADIINTDTWTKSDGTTLSLPFNDSSADLALDDPTVPVLVTDIKVVGNTPYITYGRGDNPNHHLRWAVYRSAAWEHYKVTDSRKFYEEFSAGVELHQYTPGIILNPTNPYEVVLFADRFSELAQANRLEVEVWQSPDNGATWSRSEIITKNSFYDNFRAQWSTDPSPGQRFVWCGGGTFTGFDGGRWYGYDNIRIQSEKDKILQENSLIGFSTLLNSGNYTLSGSDILDWNEANDGLNFIKTPSSTSNPVVDANNAAVFGSGDSMISQYIFSNGPINSLSVLIRLKMNPASAPNNMAVIGNFQTSINNRNFAIYITNGSEIRFLVTNNGTTTDGTTFKSYTIPYTTAETAIGFTFDGGVLKIYKDGAEVTPTKDIDGAVNAIYFNKSKLQIGHFINAAGELHTSFAPLDGYVKKVFIKKGLVTAQEITDF